MARIISAAALGGSLLLLAGGTVAWTQSSPAQLVEQRQELMKSLFPSYYRDMAQVVRGQSNDLAAVATKATQANEALKKLAVLFPAGSGRETVQKTRAKWYLAALAKRPDDGNVRSELAATYYFREPPQPEKAVEVLREALERDPGHVASLHNLAYLLIETKKFDEAEETLIRLERAEPSYPQLPGLRGELERARAGAGAGAQKSPAD